MGFILVVFFGGDCIDPYVSDALSICFCGSVKSKAHFNMLILQISVNGFRTTNHPSLTAICKEKLGEVTSVCIGVITTDDNEAI